MSRNISRQQPENGAIKVHYNSDAPAFAVCDAYDTSCGVNCFMFDRWVSSAWADVTCLRCQRGCQKTPNPAN